MNAPDGAFGVAIVSVAYFGTLSADPSRAPDHAYAFVLALTYEIAAAIFGVGLLPILFGKRIFTSR